MSRSRRRARKQEQQSKKQEPKQEIVVVPPPAPSVQIMPPTDPVTERLQKAFEEKATPKEIKDPKELYLFQCPECKGVHFRHAGYLESLLPFVHADKTAEVVPDPVQVKVCVACKKSYIWVKGQVYDVSKHIDLKAWEKTEKEAHKATGPGGQC